MSTEMIMGSITLPPNIYLAPAHKKDMDLLDEVPRLRHQLAAARKWYDSEYPPEDGHDQVYPWDHT